MRDSSPWDPEIAPLAFRFDQLTFGNLMNPDRFSDLSQHRIVLKHSCDIHDVLMVANLTYQLISNTGTAALEEKDLAAVPVLLMSWYVRFATISTSGKHLEVLTLAVRNIYVLWSSGKKGQ